MPLPPLRRYFSEDLGLEPIGGYVRVSLIHYNGEDEARRAANIIRRVAEMGPR
jgi:selenocysteine lyase/cysteine desulfurase